MLYVHLPEILEAEGAQFQAIDGHWRPRHLLWIRQTLSILEDIQNRYKKISVAKKEWDTLYNADRYEKLFLLMRISLRQALFMWNFDQLAFIKAVSSFYTHYGTTLRMLKIEQGRGTFKKTKTVQTL